jgi:hypothetical protein
MAKWSVKLEGAERLQHMLKVGGTQATVATGRALYTVATNVFNESQAQVPIDTGALRASGIVTKPYIFGNQVEVKIGYGGAAAPYAVIVHEDLEVNHAVGKSKYLEDPLTEAIPNLPNTVADSVEELLRGAK